MKKSILALTALTFALSIVSLASCGDISSVAASTANEADDYSILTVTFIYGNGSVKTQNVISGNTVADPGEDTSINIVSEYYFFGWYLGDEVYDFDTPVTENITLRSVCKRFADIHCTLAIESYDSYKLSDGEIIRGARFSEWHGTWMEEVSLNEIFTGTTVKNFSEYQLLDENGDVLSTLTGSDVITFDHIYMTIKPVETAKTVSISWNLNSGSVSSDASSEFADSTHDVSYDLTLPSTEPTLSGYTFVGWKMSALMESTSAWADDPSGEIYRPGEVIPSSVVLGFGSSVKFNAYFVSDSSVYHITTFDALFTDQEYDTDSVISIDADIDGSGADTGTGIGDGEFNGVILGNGHTITNFTIDKEDDQTCGGMIDTSCDGCGIFDWTISNAAVYDCALYGAGILIGETDGYSSIKNVTIKDCKVGGLSYYYNSSRDVYYGVDNVGGVIGACCGGGVSMSNVVVDNFDASVAIEYADGVKSNERTITLGGLIGYETSNNYPDKVVNCSVLNSNLTRSGHSAAEIGGLVGYTDLNDAAIHDGNTVSNTTIGISNASSGTLSTPSNNVGGLFGNYYGGAYRRPLSCYNVSTSKAASGVPVYISNNTVDVTTYINTNEDDTSSARFGGICPEMYFNSNGKGSNSNTIFSAITGNDITIKFTSDLQGTNNALGGGIGGYIAQDSSSYKNVVVDHNEFNVDFDAISTGTYSRVAGAVGLIETIGTSGLIFDCNAVYGSIKALPITTSTLYRQLAGFVGDSDTMDADFVYDHIYVDVDINTTTSRFGNVFSTISTSSYADETGDIYAGDHIYVNSANTLGSLCTSYYSTIDDEDVSVENLDFSSYYWEDGDDGQIHLK